MVTLTVFSRGSDFTIMSALYRFGLQWECFFIIASAFLYFSQYLTGGYKSTLIQQLHLHYFTTCV